MIGLFLALADLGALAALALYLGFFVALLAALILTSVGIVLLRWSKSKQAAALQQLSKQHGGALPDELALAAAFDAQGRAIIILLFLWPGLLSKFVALFFLMPRFSNDFYPKLLASLKEEAARQGKSLKETVTTKIGCLANLEKRKTHDAHFPLPASVVEALRAGNKIQAIKLYREATGAGLKEAKDVVEGHKPRS